MRKQLLFAACVTFVIVAPAHAQTVAITGGTVYPVSGPAIQNGTVLMRDGKIVAVGADVAVPAGAQRIDATGKIVTPGFIDASTTLGLVEIGGEPSTRDANAKGTDAIAASFRSWDGLNSESVNWAPARNEGVTSAVVLPGGGLVSGGAAMVDLADGTAAQMIRRAPVAMIAQIDNPRSAQTGARGELIGKLRNLIEDVKFYQAHRADYDRSATRSLTAPRVDLEAMIPVVEGKLPLAIEAERVDDIQAALRLAKEFNLKIIIMGGAEAWLAANDLAAAHVPVVAGAMNNIPSSFQTLNQRQENLGILSKAGVTTAIVGNNGDGDEELFNVRNIKYEAGNAVAYGMTHDAALRAVTLAPAEMFGVADHVGSLQPGRDANVVIWSGDPFEFSTHAEHVYIHGRDVIAPSRQDMLTQRYKTLPPKYSQP
ncbi:MAG TPA: amidohydrolase family protein [Gemmatimonadaceae bacterium]|nr:amidohydrolase family protein [Gemmatimonadaceae bacterium]